MRITFNGEDQTISPGLTITDLLREFDLDPRRVAVEVNRDLVPREQHADVALSEGDTIEVVTLVGGG